MASTRTLFCKHAFLADGWANNVTLSIDHDGTISDIQAETTHTNAEEQAKGPVAPAITNLHSHAFQRAMAGLAEVSGSSEDSFWTWRDAMYRLVGQLSPEDMQAVAAKLYSELLKGGFGHIVEFHYLHHQADGTAYDDPAEMSLRIFNATKQSGIGLTHLPVFYAHAGFGGTAPGDGQRPFLHSVDRFLTLLERLEKERAGTAINLGLAIHSLRAATPDEMHTILGAEQTGGPIHIHVAEQQKEVDDCLAWSGRRPVQWLLDEMPVDERWCAIHATHMTAEETSRLARSGAVAGLCPETEANLGDGIFPATDFLGANGRFGIGTDSHVATSVSEELRLLEYGQRLRDQRRNRITAGSGSSVGETLFKGALAGGAQAAGQRKHGLSIGASADLVVLSEAEAFIATAPSTKILDRWLFALGSKAVRDVMVAGQWVVQDGRHIRQEEIDRAFHAALKRQQ